MARDKGSQHREETRRQESSKAPDRASDTTDRSDSGSERQRAIQTGREAGTSIGITRRLATPAIYGLDASPFALMRRVSEDMNRLFETFGFGRTGLALPPAFGSDLDRDLWRGTSALEQAVWSPQVETFQRGDKLVVRADLPGLTKEDVDIEVNDGMLTISGERSEEQQEGGDNFYRTERSYGRFSRTIPLPEDVNEDQIDATFNNGVLEVTLPVPKQPERKAKQIPIR